MVKYFSDFPYVAQFRRYSRSKLKVVKNRAKFWMIFALPNFWGRSFQKLYPRYHTCLAVRRLKKFRENTPTSAEEKTTRASVF